jgi:hypothetical protein
MSRFAIEKVTDQALLAEVAQKAIDPWLCRLAIERVTDQLFLASGRKANDPGFAGLR